MCGIVGEVSARGPIDRQAFDRRRDLLHHRGPDDADTWMSPDAAVALGNRRLSLCDPSDAGRQPMANEDGSVQVTFNGEIYNFRALRRQLEGRGHRFRSRCDTEILAHGWEEWGEGLLERLEGMYAFALWDRRRNGLLLARDRFGIKPLYYFRGEGRFAFASEPRALVAHPEIPRQVDLSALCDFLVYRFVPSPKCIFRGLAKLPPAHALFCELESGEVRTWRHWRPSREENGVEDVGARFEELFADAVVSHTAADAPLGSLLSGGMDSSALAAMTARRNGEYPTFSIGFSHWQDSEHSDAAAVAAAFGLPNHRWLLGLESLALVERLAEVFDEPVADISTLPTLAVAALAANRVKGVLSGEGADELFGGYAWHHRLAAAAAPVADLVSFYGEAMAMGSFAEGELERLIHPDRRDALPADPLWFYRSCLEEVDEATTLDRSLAGLQWLDLRSFMGELVLTKVDRATMAASLEARVPFLDHRLFDFVYALPRQTVYRAGRQKPLLAEFLAGKIPRRILERPKQGFVGPDHYYRLDRRRLAALGDARLVRDGVFSAAGLRTMVETGGPWRRWKLLVLELWYRRWMAS
ncbi:MAG: asparagine synthase (glutamine-hydrolyzing) [Acidobacteriota bacterium]